ncbi:MAG: 4-hydroxythreonine-4-phosphate dehydrogenase PdxA [Proteobacteria bacterium]|nr:4-hydroxythreonine-4-phosphate dehydrogenase PdxA [Pseudomonadota bacterium]
MGAAAIRTALGTPILFASVAHGCAFDIAGQGIADATGVIETIELIAPPSTLVAQPSL